MKSQLRLALIGLALGVLLALVLAPQTRWLVRPQLAPGLINDAQSRRQFVQAHPDDYLVQLGGQPDRPVQTQLQYARSLVSRFPESESLRANILRYATLNLHLDRPDSSGNLLSGKPDPPPSPHPDSPPPTPAQLAAFDADAAAGERLDPDNAYFPFMRSVGLFAAHRDAEGLAAVRRAGTKTTWREYSEDEVEGGWRILDGVYGHREAVAGTAISASLLLPHYQVLRAAARLVTVKAVEEEQAGQAEEGLILRRSLAHCGDLMRAEANSYIGTLVGIAITTVSRSRPGGAAPITLEPGASLSPEINKQLTQKRLDAYCDYVTRLGHPEAAQEARAQAEAADQVRQLAAEHSFDSQFKDLTRLMLSLIAGWIIVTVLALFLLLGLAAWGLSRLPWMRRRRPLPVGTTVGVWSALVFSLLGVFLVADARSWEVTGYTLLLALMLLVPLAAFSVYAWFRPAFRRPLGQAVLAGVMTLAVLVLLAGLVAWRIRGITDYLAMIQDFQEMSSSDSQWLTNALLRGWASAGIDLAFLSVVPALLALILALAARVKRVPASVGLVEGFRAWTPPLVCALAVLYGGLTLWTVRQEGAVNYGLERSVHGEGPYLADLTGKRWPGPVR